MPQLLTDNDRASRPAKEDDEVQSLARARTLTVLARLDGSRKWSVLMVLQEAGLISVEDGPIVSLQWANLQKADLGDVVRKGADLRETKLQGANLFAAKLQGARLIKANLSGADLRVADLRETNLSRVNLSTVNLKGANVTDEQLRRCDSLEGAAMPNGQKYEEWLKSKSSGEDGENTGAS
jgi:uncharacterized protein YjbI with pentapeptide repeats